MLVEFLDSNVILRYLIQDIPAQAVAARRAIYYIAAGLLTVAVSEIVIAEVVYVLSSKIYNVPRADIEALLTPIIKLRNLKLPHKRTYLRALSLYASTRLPFDDALMVAHMERAKITTILSFDRDFDRIPGITRREP